MRMLEHKDFTNIFFMGFVEKKYFLRLFWECAISAVLFRTWLEINAITFKNQLTWRKFFWDG